MIKRLHTSHSKLGRISYSLINTRQCNQTVKSRVILQLRPYIHYRKFSGMASLSQIEPQAQPQGETSLDTLDAEISAQNDVLNQLRLSGAPSEEVDQAKAKLGELKKARAVLTGQVGKERAKKKGKDKEKGKEAEEAGRLLLKTAKVGYTSWFVFWAN